MIFFSRTWVWLAVALAAAMPVCAQPNLTGKISGGFQAPTSTDGQGRRHVLKGSDATPRGKNIYELTEPRVTSFKADDTEDMRIESPRCLYDMKSGLATSDAALSVRATSGGFEIGGTGWRWDASGADLTISNDVVALVQKSALAATNRANAASGTNPPVRIEAKALRQVGERASFTGGVLVRDGGDILRCEQLDLDFAKGGGLRRIEALREVELIQAGAKVNSGKAVYDLAADTIELTDAPRWVMTSREGSAERLLLKRAAGTVEAEGGVRMKLPATNAVAGTFDGATATAAATPATNQWVEVFSERFEHQEAAANRPARAVYREKVKVVHPQAVIRAEELTAGFDATNRLATILAERKVEIESGESRAYGEKALYDLGAEKMTLTGAPRWQLGKNTGSSGTVVFFPKTREIFALENVEMLLPGESLAGMVPSVGSGSASSAAAPAAANAPLRITSATFSHGTNVAVFHESVRVADARGEMGCEVLTVFTGASNQVSRVIAEKGVRIMQKDFTASGERADYDAATGLMLLTGSPELSGVGRMLRAETFVIDRRRNTFTVSPGRYRIEMQLNGKRDNRKRAEASAAKP